MTQRFGRGAIGEALDAAMRRLRDFVRVLIHEIMNLMTPGGEPV